MKNEKVLDLELLNETAKACFWYYGSWEVMGDARKYELFSLKVARTFGLSNGANLANLQAFSDRKKMLDLLLYAFLNGYTTTYISNFKDVHNGKNVDIEMLRHDRFSGGECFQTSAMQALDTFHYGILNYSDSDENKDYGWCYYDKTKYSLVFKALYIGVVHFDILKMFKNIRIKFLAAKQDCLDKTDKSKPICDLISRKGEAILSMFNPKYFNEK